MSESTNPTPVETNGKLEQAKALLQPGKKIEIDTGALQVWAFEHRTAVGATILVLVAMATWCLWPKPSPVQTVVHGSFPGAVPAVAYNAGVTPVAWTPPAASQAGAPGGAVLPPRNPTVAGLATVTFTVASTGAVGTNRFLNSHANYKDPANQSVCLTGAAAGVDVRALVGRKVHATGQLKVSAKSGQNYVLVSNPQGLRVE